MTYAYAVTFILGAVIGSFLNVCIYRMPRGLSIISPPSHCPSCERPIAFYDNIPIISFLILRGRCRNCKWKIPLRYPAVEFLNGLLYVLVAYRFGFDWIDIAYFAFVSSMIVIAFIDIDHQIIPDRITFLGILVGFILGSTILIDPFSRPLLLGMKASAIGLILGAGLFLLIAVLSRGGMGGGDIKMMGMVGAFLGWKGVLLTTFIGSLTGAVIGVSLMIFKGKGRKAKIPFGPFLAIGAVVSLFLGQELLRFYLHGRI